MRGAYLSFINGIPHSLDENSPRNYKINELLKRMNFYRSQAEKQNSRLAKTLKYMMTSCYGVSISRPKLLNKKYSTNVNKRVKDYGMFIASYKCNSDMKTGFTALVKCFSPHFSYPQLTKSMFENYYDFMDEISKLVKIYYSNIDAILVDEYGYNVLNDLGFVHDELGGFKIEAVLKEICIKSGRSRIGIDFDGIEYRKCVDEKISFDEFKLKCGIFENIETEI